MIGPCSLIADRAPIILWEQQDNGAENETKRVRQLIMGFRTTQLIYVAAKFELADHLARGPLTPRDLAAAASRHLAIDRLTSAAPQAILSGERAADISG